MNFNVENFTGEFQPALDGKFKIPLKSDIKNCLKANAETPGETFSSPLAAEDATYASSYNPSYSQPHFYVEQQLEQQTKSPTDLKRKRTKEDDSQLENDALPVELKKMLLPLFCELCSVKSNSSVSAKMHYDSKTHDKKVNAWLLEWSKKTGEPVPKREKKFDGPSGPNAFHCTVCDLALTSQQHANQHYMGKKHRLAVSGRSMPSGYYNDNGQFVRTKTKVTADPSGRFDIGAAFQIKPETSKTDTAITTDPIGLVSPNYTDNPNKYCKICDVTVTSVQHMKLHLEGSKHAKKLRAMGAPPYANADDTILSSLDKKVPTKRDNSIYRTPSGSYYCKPCNVTLTTESLFNQHLDSKKHNKCIRLNASGEVKNG